MIKKLRTLTPDMATVTVVNDGRRIARNVDPSRTCSMTAICVCVCVCGVGGTMSFFTMYTV